jgi:outer membrane receptor for ferrienterochelin and colicin
MRHNIMFFLIYIFSVFNLNAQTGTIEGSVYNSKNNEPIPFANLVIMGTTIGTSSDIDGKFLFKSVSPGYVRLMVTSLGFENFTTTEFMVTNYNPARIDIPMIEKSISLKGVEVHTGAFEKKEESPLSMRTIGIQDIEKNPGGNRDISKVIQSFPGVASTPNYRNDVIVRGGGASENRFYLDDVEIPNLNHFATQGASGGPVGIINVDFIRTVDFYSGAFPADRGNALSSIIDMKQIDGSKDKLNFKLTLGASDYGLSMDGPLGKKTTFLLSARRSYLKLLFSALKLPFLPTYNDIQFKTKIDFDKKHQLTIIGLGAIDQNKLNLNANKTEAQRYILSYLPVNDQWNYTLGVVYKQFRKNSYDTWVLSRNMLRNSIYKYKDNDKSNPDNLIQDYKSDEIENKLRFENTSRYNNFKITYGAGLEYDKYTNKTFQRIFINGAEQSLNYNSFIEIYKWNFFGQVSKGILGERLNLSFGLRADGNSFNPSMSNPLNQISPRFSAGWSITDRWSLNFNVGRYYQLPAYTTLGYRDSDGVLVNKQNDLRYISVDHYVLGVGYQDNKNVQVTLEGFYKSYMHYPFSVRDSISLASKGADFSTFGDEEVSSTSKGRAYGAELLFRIKMLKGFNVLLSYTFVRSEFTAKTKKYIPSAWDNRHLVTFTVSKKFKYNWYIGMKWKFLGGGPYTPYDLTQSSLISAWNVQGRAYLDYGQYNTLRLKSYHQLDIRLDKEFYWRKWSLNIYADVQNIYNSKAIGPDNYILATDENGVPLIDPTDPSRYMLKAIPNEMGTILPTVGIIIGF